MLARTNSDAAARLRRSKSVSTVHEHPPSIVESVDLDAVRQQALAAATTAFARAQLQDAIEHNSRRSSDLLKSKSNASRKSLTTQGNHFLLRGSSFRSMQAPKVEQGKSSQRKPQTSISHPRQTTEQPSCLHPTPTSGESLTVPQQLSQEPSVTLAENAKPSFHQKMARPSIASSVTSQQIRKARSMYYASSIQTGSPIARPPAKYLTPTPSDVRSLESETSSIQPPTRILGSSPLTEPRMPVTVAPGTTLNEARDEYLHEFRQNSVKHKPSMFLAPFKKRQDKAKGKAKSSSSYVQIFSVSRDNTPIERTIDTTLSDFIPQQELKEKRSFSGSLKHRIKRVFRRTSAKPIDLPVQHIKASRQYFDAPHLSPLSIGDTSSIPCPDETTLKRVRGRTSSLEKARPMYLRSEYRSDSTGSGRSARSLHSEVNAPPMPASRVTSWGTTSTSDTLTQRSIKRMTVIHESKDSNGSEAERFPSAAASRRKSLPLPPLASFRDPMPMHSLLEEESSSIDPKRVFSALMREMRTTKSSREMPLPMKSTSDSENGVFESNTTMVMDKDLSCSSKHNVRTGIEADQRTSSRQSVIAHSVQGKTSTVKAFGKAIRSTVRAVTPAGQHLSPNSESTTIAADAVSVLRNGVSFPSAAKPGPESSRRGSSTTKRQYLSPPYIPSPSQIEKRMEKSRHCWKVHLEDPEHFQFPRETDKTFDVTASVRQAYATPSDSTKSSKKSEPHDYSVIEEDSVEPPLSLEVPKSTCREMPMSPSIYSRNTDGNSISLNDSVTSFNGPGQPQQLQNAGSAVILTSQSVRSYALGTPSPQRQEVAHTSRDWRVWLSHEISTIETSSREDLSINGKYGKFAKRDGSDSAHVSNAQDEDTAADVHDVLDTTVPQPDRNASMAADIYCRVENPSGLSDKVNKSMSSGATFSEERDLFTNTSNTDDANCSCSNITSTSQVHSHSQLRSASLSMRPLHITTTNVGASYHADINSPKYITKSGQVVLTTSIQCSSSNSLASRHSTSPANGVAASSFLKSSKSTPEEGSRSSLSARLTHEASQYMETTPLKRHDTQIRRKENLSPKSLHAHKQSTPSLLTPLSRPKSHQLLSSSKSNRNTSTDQLGSATTPGIASTKSQDNLATTPLRPRLRVIARPISPEKRTYQPKSALNLQTTSNFESPAQITDFSTAPLTSSPQGICA